MSNQILLILLSASLSALFTGAGFFLLWGPKVMTKKEHQEVCPEGHHVMTDKGHEKVCSLKAAPIALEISHLKEAQGRVEGKVDSVAKKLDAVLTRLPPQREIS